MILLKQKATFINKITSVTVTKAFQIRKIQLKKNQMVNKYSKRTILIEIMMIQKKLLKKKIVLKNKNKILLLENKKKMEKQNKMSKKKRKPNWFVMKVSFFQKKIALVFVHKGILEMR